MCAAILRKTHAWLYSLNGKWQAFPRGRFSIIISLSTFQSSSFSSSSPSTSCPRLLPSHGAFNGDISCRSDLLPARYPLCSYPCRGNGRQPCRLSVPNRLKDPFTRKVLMRDYRKRVAPLRNASSFPEGRKDITGDLPVTLSNSAMLCGEYYEKLH